MTIGEQVVILEIKDLAPDKECEDIGHSRETRPHGCIEQIVVIYSLMYKNCSLLIIALMLLMACNPEEIKIEEPYEQKYLIMGICRQNAISQQNSINFRVLDIPFSTRRVGDVGNNWTYDYATDLFDIVLEKDGVVEPLNKWARTYSSDSFFYWDKFNIQLYQKGIMVFQFEWTTVDLIAVDSIYSIYDDTTAVDAAIELRTLSDTVYPLASFTTSDIPGNSGSDVYDWSPQYSSLDAWNKLIPLRPEETYRLSYSETSPDAFESREIATSIEDQHEFYKLAGGRHFAFISSSVHKRFIDQYRKASNVLNPFVVREDYYSNAKQEKFLIDISNLILVDRE